jgi:hypothetical protein
MKERSGLNNLAGLDYSFLVSFIVSPVQHDASRRLGRVRSAIAGRNSIIISTPFKTIPHAPRPLEFKRQVGSNTLIKTSCFICALDVPEAQELLIRDELEWSLVVVHPTKES